MIDTQLNAEYVSAEPQHRNWAEGYPEDWDYWEAVECPLCGTTVTGSGYVLCEHEDTPYQDDEAEEILAEGPMMDYLYPLALHMDPDEAARRIADLPLCIITDTYTVHGLALTGGGMDLSWEIAAAYVRLGHLPPVHFADLPQMAGQDVTTGYKAEALAAMRESLAFMVRNTQWRLERLNEKYSEGV